MLERGLEQDRLPALGLLQEAGTYLQGTTTFPSVTPVCLTSIATGAHPDMHGSRTWSGSIAARQRSRRVRLVVRRRARGWYAPLAPGLDLRD